MFKLLERRGAASPDVVFEPCACLLRRRHASQSDRTPALARTVAAFGPAGLPGNPVVRIQFRCCPSHVKPFKASRRRAASPASQRVHDLDAVTIAKQTLGVLATRHDLAVYF